jgi:sterol desaturase/sphingolipid hydroxylase (fatty acid hydroxylase superfamily)
MSAQDYVTNVAFVVAVMAFLAVVEIAAPLVAARGPLPGRRLGNLGMTVQTLLFNFVLAAAATAFAAIAPLSSPAWLHRSGLPPLLQAVVGVAALDFAFGYVAHRAMHASPWLWRFHRVHHSDPFVDVTTTYRTHPVESAWRYLCLSVPIWLLGVPAATVLAYRVLSAVNGLLEHANVRVNTNLDAAASTLWVTPNFHKVHHSMDRRETDTNYGNLLSIHDRLLRTYTPGTRAAAVTYGLEDVDPAGVRSVGQMLAMPWNRGRPVVTEVAA